MDHSHALETQAAERYLLGELLPGEAEEFERHFFECPHCALAVESGQEFIEGVRMQPRTTQAEAGRRPFWDALKVFGQPAFALPALACLAALCVYQGSMLTALRHTLNEARPLPAFQLIGASRGQDAPVRAPAGAPFIALAADIPPDAHFRNYVCVVSNSGAAVFKVVNPAPEAGHPITILVPAGELRPGKQELAIFGQGPDGQPAEKISTYPFDFETR